MTDPAVARAFAEAFQAFNERRFADFAQSVSEDVVEIYPQSGERFEGRDAQRRMHEALPEPPVFTIRAIHHSGDLAVLELDETYEDGSVWKDAIICQLRDGRVAQMICYFSPPFPAPAWRRPHTVRG
jgi:ketosteroid isomerase-like protein